MATGADVGDTPPHRESGRNHKKFVKLETEGYKDKLDKIQKHFQNVMLVGMASEISKTTHTSVWIAQDTTESRVPRLNVHTNQILAHTFSLGTLDSVVS